MTPMDALADTILADQRQRGSTLGINRADAVFIARACLRAIAAGKVVKREAILQIVAYCENVPGADETADAILRAFGEAGK